MIKNYFLIKYAFLRSKFINLIASQSELISTEKILLQKKKLTNPISSTMNYLTEIRDKTWTCDFNQVIWGCMWFWSCLGLHWRHNLGTNLLLDALHDNRRILAAKPAKKCWYTHCCTWWWLSGVCSEFRGCCLLGMFFFCG